MVGFPLARVATMLVGVILEVADQETNIQPFGNMLFADQCS
jgi:hypothetical protein